MEPERLEYFLKIAETGSFSEAAEQLFTTQSTVSKQIALLERDLGVPLFDRSHRLPALTAAGAALLPEAREFLAQYRAFLSKAAACRGTFRLALFPVAGYYGFSQAIAAFCGRRPEFQLQVMEEENGAIPALLEEGGCDAAVWRAEEGGAFPADAVSLCRDELALVVPAGHPLADRPQPVELSDFAGEKFLIPGQGARLRGQILSACRQAGFTPQILYTGSSGETIARLVEQGAGAGIFMRRVALGLCGPSLRVLRFARAPQSEMLFAVRAGARHSPAARALRQALSAWAREEQRP